MNGTDTVCVARVQNRKTRSDFLRVPHLIYADDPTWIAPLRFVEAERLNSKVHPFYDHGQASFWVAYSAGAPVGRISAQINQLHLDRYQSATGHFGHIEGQNRQEIFDQLFTTAEKWLAERGIGQVTGPFDLSINEQSGILVDGFNEIHSFLTAYSKPYYGERVEQSGYQKAKDLLAFEFRRNSVVPKEFIRLADTLDRYPNYRIRRAHGDDYFREFRLAIDIFNDAWSENWNFVPFTEKETNNLVKGVKHFVKTDYLWFLEKDDEPIAFIAAIPDINEATSGLRGRLLPFGWTRFLWRTKVRGLKRARISLLGIRGSHQMTAFAAVASAALVLRIRSALINQGLDSVDISWVLEDNTGLLKILELMELKRNRRFRIYQKTLSSVADRNSNET